MGSFLSRTLIMVFGYAYPAYECFKVVENKGSEDIQQLLFWCQYWIFVALFSVCERIGDSLISWLPLYSEAKLALIIYLWHPKTRGALYVYKCFLEPFMSRYETEIDRNLLDIRVKAGDIAFLYWQKVSVYGRSKLFEIFYYLSSQRGLNARSEEIHYSPLLNSYTTDRIQSEVLDSDSTMRGLKSHDENDTQGLEKMEIESTSLGLDNGDCNSSKKQKVLRQSRWKLFRNAANP